MDIQSISHILLLMILLLQSIVLLHMLYTNHKRYLEDQRFWKLLAEQEKAILESIQNEDIHLLSNEEQNKSL